MARVCVNVQKQSENTKGSKNGNVYVHVQKGEMRMAMYHRRKNENIKNGQCVYVRKKQVINNNIKNASINQ